MLELIDGRDTSTPVHIARPQRIDAGSEAIASVSAIVDDVRLRGDAAVREHTLSLDGVAVAELRVGEGDIVGARRLVRPELIDAFEFAADRLRVTSERQLPETWYRRDAGATVGELVRPIRRVGVHVPGGRAACPSTVIMAAIPARVAGVDNVAVCSPPNDGEIAESVLAACAVAGITEVYRAGGAQAIAALAYGTESIRPVDKIVGPGTIYVTLAKRLVEDWVGVDSEAGPTEIAIIADETADSNVIASDLIAQAEPGPLGVHALITWVPELADEVVEALAAQVPLHERAEELENTLIEGGRAVLVRDLDHALDTANALAPEHLELIVDDVSRALDRVVNAGAVFVGPASPVPAGDYVGTNHILPTGGAARWASGLSVLDFVKRIYVCELEEQALERFAPHIDALAEAEGSHGHSRAVQARLEGGSNLW